MEQLGFPEFLNWLVFGGGSVMASSWLLERWAWFQTKTSDVKRFISFASASILSIVAYALVTFAPGFIEQASPFFMILASVFSMVFLSNVFHKATK